MTTLNLTIRGLCGLVPSSSVPTTPTSQPFPIRRLRVLVLDAATLARGPICPHHPRLTVGNGAPVPLGGHTIAIEGLDSSSRRVNLLPPGFWDLAQIDQITPAPFRVADGFLTHPPRLPGLIASLSLTAGVVEGIDPLSQVQVFANGYRKAFAQAVHMRLPLNGPGKILLTRFDAQAPEHSINLVPDAQDSVNVELSNLCDPSHDLDAEDDLEGSDFATYYSLLHEYPGPLFIPRTADLEESQSHPGEVNGEASSAQSGCIPSLFSSHPGA